MGRHGAWRLPSEVRLGEVHKMGTKGKWKGHVRDIQEGIVLWGQMGHKGGMERLRGRMPSNFLNW